MSKTLADILRSYIPDGDGYNSEYAHNLNAAADALESQQSAPAGYVIVSRDLLERIVGKCKLSVLGDDHAKAWELLAAAPAAPAADASDVLDQAMYTLISIGYHENSGLVHELRQALAARRAKGVV